MKPVRLLQHAAADAAVLLTVLGLPVVSTDTGRALLKGSPDAVSSASVIIDKPSGEYVVLINRSLHPDEANLRLWEQFFTEKDAPVIFEDISCLTGLTDAGGRAMADSCRSRLPENQMTVQAIDTTLLLSKAEYGLFDVMILSKEIAEAGGVQTLYGKPDILVLHVKDTEAAE